jgi:hypothetical protein
MDDPVAVSTDEEVLLDSEDIETLMLLEDGLSVYWSEAETFLDEDDASYLGSESLRSEIFDEDPLDPLPRNVLDEDDASYLGSESLRSEIFDEDPLDLLPRNIRGRLDQPFGGKRIFASSEDIGSDTTTSSDNSDTITTSSNSDGRSESSDTTTSSDWDDDSDNLATLSPQQPRKHQEDTEETESEIEDGDETASKGFASSKTVSVPLRGDMMLEVTNLTHTMDVTTNLDLSNIYPRKATGLRMSSVKEKTRERLRQALSVGDSTDGKEDIERFQSFFRNSDTPSACRLNLHSMVRRVNNFLDVCSYFHVSLIAHFAIFLRYAF